MHVVVGLQAGARDQLGTLPFHTTLLDWQPAYPAEGLDQERAVATLEEALQQLSVEVRQLMQTLRGSEAD